MSGFDLLSLEKSWFSEVNNKKTKLSPEVIGKIVACAILVHGNLSFKAFTTDDVENVFFSSSAPIPDEIVAVLHIESGPEKMTLQEKTELTLGAQRVGITARFNPENRYQHPKWNSVEALHLLGQYASVYPGVVAWIKNSVQELAAHGQKKEAICSAR